MKGQNYKDHKGSSGKGKDGAKAGQTKSTSPSEKKQNNIRATSSTVRNHDSKNDTAKATRDQALNDRNKKNSNAAPLTKQEDMAAKSNPAPSTNPLLPAKPIRTLIEEALQGKFDVSTMTELKRSIPKKNLLIFVSSTFLDTRLERTLLHQKILPYLQSQAARNGLQINFYDMRFGVKDENTKDHMTWISCREAIQQCYDESDALFFLSLQADRYGYCPLPKYLDQKVVSFLGQKSRKPLPDIDQLQTLFKEWYLLDENHLPPRYELKSLQNLNDPQFWGTVLPKLREELLDNIAFEPCDQLPEESLMINRSVTEWETLYAFNCDKTRCFWIRRTFDKELLQALSDVSLSDTKTNGSLKKKLEILTAKMMSTLQEPQYHQFLSTVSPQSYLSEDADCQTYLAEWDKVVRSRLEEELQNVKAKVTSWITDNEKHFNMTIAMLEEILFHCLTAFDANNQFIGRTELLERCLQFFHSCDDDSTKSKVFALVGVSGSGKTTLMAKIALSLSAASNGTIPVIIRFCGTSGASTNGFQLLQSIAVQLCWIYKKSYRLVEVLKIKEYKDLVTQFQELLKEHPVYLLIDSLDQLSNRYEERSKVNFLRDITLHPQSLVIVSTLPDEYDAEGKPGSISINVKRP